MFECRSRDERSVDGLINQVAEQAKRVTNGLPIAGDLVEDALSQLGWAARKQLVGRRPGVVR